MAPLITITIHALLTSVGLKQQQQQQHQAPLPASIPAHPPSTNTQPCPHQPVSPLGSKAGTTSLTACTWGTNRNDIFGQDPASGDISHKWWDGQGWGPAGDALEDLGGSSPLAPAAVVWGANRMDVFAVSAAGNLTHKYWTGSAWEPSETGVEDLGGGLETKSASLAATSWGEGRLDAFGIAAGGGSLLHKYYDGSQWGPPGGGLEDHGGSLATGVSAVSWGPGRLDIVGADSAGDVQHLVYDGTKWAEWETLDAPGVAISEPKIVSWGVNRLDIFGINTDGALWHTAWEGTKWLAWENLGGSNLVGPVDAVSWSANRIDIVALGGDGQYYYKYYDGYQWNPTDATLYPKGGNFSSGPALTSWGANRLDIFGVTTDGQLGHQTYYGSGWYPDWGFEMLGGTLAMTNVDDMDVHKELRV